MLTSARQFAPSPPTANPAVGWLARLHSLFNAWRIAHDQRFYRPRAYREHPAMVLTGLSADVRQRIEQLQARYGLAFEQHLDRGNALENYVYLDLLDRVPSPTPLPVSSLLDVGCKNFYYVRALVAAFAPQTITGLELEGYRRYRSGHCRHDYAEHYLAHLPEARFVSADVAAWHKPAALVTCWYPFVQTGTALSWGLPLAHFDPAAFFAQLASLISPGGYLLVVNQGRDEWSQAQHWLHQQPLVLVSQQVIDTPLLPRPAPPVLSWWQRSA